MVNDFISTLDHDYHLKYLWTFREGFKEALENLPSETKVQDLIKMVHIFRQSAFDKQKIKFIFDKNPQYTLFIDHLAKIFPEANFFRQIRDPRDNFTSHKKHSKRGPTYLALKWLKYNQLFDKSAAKAPDKFATLKFEYLIENQLGFIKEFEQFTKLYDVAIHENKRISKKGEIEEKFDDKLKVQHQASVKPLDKKKVGHYKSILGADQIATINTITFPYAAKYNYTDELPQKKLNNKEVLSCRFSFWLHKIGNRTLYNMPFNQMIQVHYLALKYVAKGRRNKLAKLEDAGK